MVEDNKKSKVFEFICALYIQFLSGFIWINKVLPNTDYIVIGLLVFLLGFYFLKNPKVNITTLLINGVMLFIFLGSRLLFNNLMLEKYFKDFILNGFIVIILFSKVKNFDNFLKYLAYGSIFSFIVNFTDPFNGYVHFSGYMSFGLKCALPCFSMFYIQRRFYEKKIFLPFEILSIVLLSYSNRNSILTAIVLVFVLEIFYKKSSKERVIKFVSAVIIIAIVLINLEKIISVIFNYIGDTSYAIRAIHYWISGESNGLAGRDYLWQQAFYGFKKMPLYGYGIGNYHSKYGTYCHNIFLDLIFNFGIFGFIFIIYLFKEIVVNLLKEKNNIIFYVLVVLGIIPLLFNSTFIGWGYFWLLIYYIVDKSITKLKI